MEIFIDVIFLFIGGNKMGKKISVTSEAMVINNLLDSNLIRKTECYELFWDDNKQKYFPQYKRRARDIWRAYVLAFCSMFTGRGVYGSTETNHLDWEERIAAIIFNLINFGGLASLMFGITNLLLPVFGISNLSYLVFGFINLSPFLLVVGGILVLTGFYLA